MESGSRSRYKRLDIHDRHEGLVSEIELAEIPKSRYIPSLDGTQDTDTSLLVQNSHLLSSGRFDSHKTALIRYKREKLQGWHFGVSRSAWLATAVLVLNFFITIVAVAKFGSQRGVGTAFEGSCTRASAITIALHVVINVLSSALLGASNYTMQALVAPTREEVDRAHSNGDWIDIGVSSIRNLSKINRRRAALWIVLGLSSIPIHLFYNSAVFKSIGANEYYKFLANPDWLRGGNFSTSRFTSDESSRYNWESYFSENVVARQHFFSENAMNSSLVKNLSLAECLSAYSLDFISANADVILVTMDKGNSINETFFEFNHVDIFDDLPPGVLWPCDWYADTECDANTWTVNGRRIEYCLSHTPPQHCTIQFSVYILIAVICMNATKSIAMFVTVHKYQEATLVTVGDAVASHLENPDRTTTGSCLMGRKDARHWAQKKNESQMDSQSLPKAFKTHGNQRWCAAVGPARWITCFGLIILAIVGSGVLLDMATHTISYNEGSPWHLGWGAIDTKATLLRQFPGTGTSALVTSVLLANLPQAVVSFLYVLYNSLMTSLLLAKEWSDYATDRKPLRVTTRAGSQRSTYYLQLPYRYSLPLLVVMGTLHWVISQSIFLARIKTYRNGEERPYDPYDPAHESGLSTIGYSPPPILTAMLIGITLMIFAICLGFRRLDSSMPVAGSCSLAIAAACHRPKGDDDAHLLPVQWGEVGADEVNGEVGHCCFTSQPVTSPVPGRLYA